MIRHVAAVAVALCLSPSWLYAQSTELKVNTASANVHKYPSIGSPVIGKAPRGAVLEVTRELGDWVKVSWPDAQDGVGYVYLSVGSFARSSASNPSRAAGFTSARPAAASAPPTTRGAQVDHTGAGEQLSPMPTEYIRPQSHFVGLGGRMMGGSTVGFGATARTWSRGQPSFQLAVSHASQTSVEAPGRVASLQIAPSLLYSLRDRLSDHVWVRPYLGGGGTFLRQSLSGVTPGAVDSVTKNGLGFQGFGGAEFTFPSVPRFGLSADVGYYWLRDSFPGFDVGGVGVTVSGHWYVK
ncbi:MAG: SH3 domain-containing protein [bacterium]